MKRTTLFCTAAACSALLASNAFAQVIWDSTSDANGNVYVSNPGEGCEEPPGSGTFLGDLSLLLNADLDKNVLGFGCQADLDNRMADDFELCQEAQISSFQFFSYQTNATTQGITGIGSLNIWNGRPGDCTGPSVIFSTDATPPSLVEAGWTSDLYTSSVYRASQTSQTSCARRQQTVIVHFDPPITLPAGVYWVDVSIADDMVTGSGPWMAPLTNTGTPNTGNAMQFTGTWNEARDGADDQFNNGIPFIVNGTGGTCAPGEHFPPSNDAMANALVLPCDFGAEAYNLVAATPDGAGASCAGGGPTDCDGDISSPTAQGVPDGTVGVDDFLWVFANWGDCPGGTPGCDGDISSPTTQGVPDGTVGVDDFLWVFANWGDCPVAGDGPTANLWYCYTATVTDCHLVTAGAGAGVAVYEGCDGSGGEVACDLGSVQLDATEGTTYLIEVFQDGAIAPAPQLEVIICPPCVNAQPIAIDEIVTGDTTGAASDPLATLCDSITPSAGGRWYEVVGDGNVLTATTCFEGTLFDTQISVYCGDCLDLFCVGADDEDDLCFVTFVGASTFSWCSEAGETYKILVHGAVSAEGAFAMQVTSDGSPCSDPPVCGLVPCVVCPAGASLENEPCLVAGDTDTTNGGCNSDPNVFGDQLAINGPPVCGVASTYGGSRDTDWYLLTHAGGDLTTTLESDFPGISFIIDVTDCDNTVILGDFVTTQGSLPGGTCDVASVTNNLPAGQYVIFVSLANADGSGIFEGYDCDTGFNNYVVSVTSP